MDTLAKITELRRVMDMGFPNRNPTNMNITKILMIKGTNQGTERIKIETEKTNKKNL